VFSEAALRRSGTKPEIGGWQIFLCATVCGQPGMMRTPDRQWCAAFQNREVVWGKGCRRDHHRREGTRRDE
jgi:hypothetical protein